MRPSRGILAKALMLSMVAAAVSSAPALAQFYDPAVASLGLNSDVARSPRLLGMGSLSLVVPDRYQRISLWDFAGSPLGLADVDSTSGLDLRPGTGSASGAFDPVPNYLRENLAGRTVGMPFEVFSRDREGNAAGAVGTLSSVRSDFPYDADRENRTTVKHPEVMPVMTGPFPYWGKGKLHYAVRLDFADETQQQDCRNYIDRPNGQFISLDGPLAARPDRFAPSKYSVRTMGFGGALSYPLGHIATLAIGLDERKDRIEGSDLGDRSESQVDEDRPTRTAQVTLIGKLGRSVEFGADLRQWASAADQTWMFTTSSGSGVVPLGGRGVLLKRDAKGSSFNSRVLLTSGPLHLGAQLWTRWERVSVTPPKADGSSFNVFLATVYNHAGADTLGLPDSVVANRAESRAFGIGTGASLDVGKGIAGLEFHWAKDDNTSNAFGPGPKPLGWSLRAGFEYPCSKVVTGRIGATAGRQDEDDYTANNEWNDRSVSAGFSVRPVGTTWGFDLGYAYAWGQSAYGDPQDHRNTHQQVQTLVHWAF